MTRKLFYINGEPQWLTPDEQVERGLLAPPVAVASGLPGIPSRCTESHPHLSLSMGCHHSQVGMMREAIKANGIQGVEYVPDRHGYKCKITSMDGARRWMDVYGRMHGQGALHNEDAGYQPM